MRGGGGWIRTTEGVEPADLQSAPFGHSGTPPYVQAGLCCGTETRCEVRAGGGTRTRDLLITSQVLYQLSYASGIVIEFSPLEAQVAMGVSV